MAKDFKLDISMFERLMNCGVSHKVLRTQRRMRPEISRLIHPFYVETTISDHEVVTKYENVKGMGQNVFFFNHNHVEARVSEAKSRSNVFEADIVTSLCDYLIKQGYEASEITVLTMYSGQLFLLNERFQEHAGSRRLKNVRRRVVDKFQGEENEIIILSLVRSNESGNVGFLKLENRVVVALSRAKKGLFVFGNITMLSESADTWATLLNILKANRCIGDKLMLKCQKHTTTDTEIRQAKDFSRVPEGGCDIPCNTRLDCGHTCPRSCHPENHDSYDCLKPCTKVYETCGHKCRNRCFRDCGKCMKIMSRVIPRCGHIQDSPCHLALDDIKCISQCDKSLPVCGHPCQLECIRPCACNERVTLRLGCGHSVKVDCNNGNPVNALTIKCQKSCKETLECGHKCPGKCFECSPHQVLKSPFGQIAHQSCKEHCTRPLICGHPCGRRHACTDECRPCERRCPTKCVHSRRCEHKCGELCPPCKEKCSWRCPHFACSKMCHEPCDRPPCNEPCTKKQTCGHPCMGVCGEVCPGVCQKCRGNQEVWDDTMTAVPVKDVDPELRFIKIEHGCHIVEVEALDMWMNLEPDRDIENDEKEGVAVKLKTCPSACTTPIRRILRYGTQINQTLSDLESIKRKMLQAFAAAQGLTKEERNQIDKAFRDLGARAGHWFKCPNGHFYYIGDCGGAMEIGQCNECGQ
eukprot:716278_1